MSFTITELVAQQDALIRDETAAGSITKTNVANILNNISFEYLRRGIGLVNEDNPFDQYSGSDFNLIVADGLGVYVYDAAGTPDPPNRFAAKDVGTYDRIIIPNEPNLPYRCATFQIQPPSGTDVRFSLLYDTIGFVAVIKNDPGDYSLYFDNVLAANQTVIPSVTTGNTNPAFTQFATWIGSDQILVQFFDSGVPSDDTITKGFLEIRMYG